MTDKATHTPLPASDLLPISYRPDPFDDWGTIRAAPGSTGAGGVAWSMGRIRDPRVLDADLWKFRVAGTDPYEAVGKMFVHAVNSHHRLVEALGRMIEIAHAYGEYISQVPSAELERHPYLPGLEDEINDARAALKEAGHG